MKISNFKFSNPKIIKFHFDTNLKYVDKGKVKIRNKFNVQVNRTEGKNEAIVQLNIITGTDCEENEAPFIIDMEIVSAFRWDDVYDEKTLNDLLNKNAPALLLSYARPIISSMTAFSLVTPYTLPFFDFTE